VFGSSSTLCASWNPQTCLANSMMATCIPRQRPRYGTLFSLAYFAAEIIPSTPREPNPPGTMIPAISPSSSFALSSFNVSESIQWRSTVARSAIPPCFNASTTEMYASCSAIYFPTKAIFTSLFGWRRESTIASQSFKFGSGQSKCRALHATLARFSFSMARGAS